MKKNVLILAIGGSGSNVAELLCERIQKEGGLANCEVTAFAFDSDAGDMQKLKNVTVFSLWDSRSIGAQCDSIGRDRISEWFPVPDEGQTSNEYSAQELHKYVMWRKKAFLSFNTMLNDSVRRERLHSALNDWVAKQPEGPFRILTVASLAGNSGSALFLPLTLYVKNYLRNLGYPEAEAYAALLGPEIYTHMQANIPGATVKVHSHAYAALRELNAINEVALGNSEGVRFRLGAENSPTGILFDSDAPQFRDKARIPFHQVYLMDKLPTCDSIQAHEGSLSAFLYSLLCNNAYSFEDNVGEYNTTFFRNPRAIYAGVASAQMEFPLDAILSYAAHQKALDSIQKEWMILHNAVEERIEREREEAKRNREVYGVSTAQYAEMYLEAMEREVDCHASSFPLASVLSDVKERTVADDDAIRRYVSRLEAMATALIPEPPKWESRIQTLLTRHPVPRLFGRRSAKEYIQQALPDALKYDLDRLTEYYQECDKTIRSNTIADQVFPLDLEKEDREHSLFRALLCEGEEFLHPVVAMTRLCLFRRHILSLDIPSRRDAEWPSKEETVPANLLTTGRRVDAGFREYERSVYATLREDSFPDCLLSIAQCPEEYVAQSTSPLLDALQCDADVSASLHFVEEKAKRHLIHAVFTEIAKRVDMLIEGYRAFFHGLEQQKEVLDTKTKAALCRGARSNGPILFTGADQTQKEAMYRSMADEARTEEDFASCSSALGKFVFTEIYESTQDRLQELRGMPKDNSSREQTDFFTFLDVLVGECSKQLKRTSAYRSIERQSAFESFFGRDRSLEESKKALIQHLQALYQAALPSLKVTSSEDAPAYYTLLLLSAEAADFLWQNATELGLEISSSSAVDVKRRCAVGILLEQCGLYHTSFLILENGIPGHIIMASCSTGLLPSQLHSFNETVGRKERNAFSCYLEAVSHVEEGRQNGGDMWNPHLGMDLHKPGHLLYLDPRMDRFEDEKIAKAFLFALQEGQFAYEEPEGRLKAFRCIADGRTVLARKDTPPATVEVPAHLFIWIRSQTELTEKWSTAFDEWLEETLESLPVPTTPAEECRLERFISHNIRLVDLLSKNVYGNVRGLENDENAACGLLDFAHRLFVTDRRAAEALLRVGQEVLLRLCSHRYNLKTESGVAAFSRVYRQKLRQLVRPLLLSKAAEAIGNPLGYANAALAYANSVPFRMGEDYRLRAGGGPFCFGMPEIDFDDPSFLLLSPYVLEEEDLERAKAEAEARARRAHADGNGK